MSRVEEVTVRKKGTDASRTTSIKRPLIDLPLPLSFPVRLMFTAYSYERCKTRQAPSVPPNSGRKLYRIPAGVYNELNNA
jgi:hypothetical protein